MLDTESIIPHLVISLLTTRYLRKREDKNM